jgi:signal transduction histidine kinase
MDIDIILEILRVVITGAIFIILLQTKKYKQQSKIPGLKYLIIGFGLIFVGNIFDLTDNFEQLNKFIIIGDTKVEAFIEKFICFLLGFVFLFVGFKKWLPMVMGLEKAKNEAEEASQAKSEFLANISHELRTPMHGILSYANFGIDKIDKVGKDKLLSYFTNINVSGERLLLLLNDLLDLSKLSADSVILDKKIIPLKDIVEIITLEYDAFIEEKNLHINITSSEDTTAMLDRQQMQQVIRNLLSNAIKFTPNDKTISISINQLEDATIKMVIADEGMGIPEGELDSIFDEFVQSSKTKTGKGGTGLGLAITRKIIKKHGGNIFAENRDPVGSSFTIILPIK